jgi:hypothetical protein
MEKQDSQHLYTIEDLNKAFDMGLENAVYIIETSMDLTRVGQRYMLQHMKKKILEDRLSAMK